MGGFLRQLVNNLSSIILALLLAVAIWIAATLQDDPFTVQSFPSIPVTPVDQPEDTVFFEGEQARVSVEVRAPQSVLEELQATDFQAEMDLAEVPLGEVASVPISVTVASEAVRIQDYSPKTQQVHLERLTTAIFPVSLHVEGEPATGYRAGDPTLRPSDVSVSGPTPYVTEVVSVTGSISIEGVRADVSQRVSIAPRREDGTLVTEVEWTPQQVQVGIEVQRRVGFKPDVQVVPDLRGDPAPGYRRASVSVEPSTVTLAGSAPVLATLPGFIKTEPISITGATEGLSLLAALSVPTNVVVIEDNRVMVNVEILPVLSSRSITSTVQVEGLRLGWRATLSPPAVEIIVEGPETLLGELLREDVEVVLNLAGYVLGVHRLSPEVVVPENVSVVSIIPETIEVVIDVAPSPTPTSTLSLENP
jgi:YbbR domain-containing protein